MFYSHFDHARKVALLTLLLAQPMVIQAQPDNTSAVAVKNEGQEREVDSGSGGAQQRAYFFPRWPERREVRRERVPPPPPGPYMSSALTGNSIESPSFSPGKQPEVKSESAAAPQEAFSPDIPWPGNSESPHRWLPETGYNYVQPQAVKQPYSSGQGYNNYGYPVRNWPAANPGTIPGGSYSR